ncbi:MAG: hypothetical protein LBB78_01500 [Spirochaetaceae bacterium]|nr:hypothetical protein [Spirochaetaceae bacterium]
MRVLDPTANNAVSRKGRKQGVSDREAKPESRVRQTQAAIKKAPEGAWTILDLNQ